MKRKHSGVPLWASTSKRIHSASPKSGISQYSIRQAYRVNAHMYGTAAHPFQRGGQSLQKSRPPLQTSRCSTLFHRIWYIDKNSQDPAPATLPTASAIAPAVSALCCLVYNENTNATAYSESVLCLLVPANFSLLRKPHVIYSPGLYQCQAGLLSPAPWRAKGGPSSALRQ